MLYSSFLNEMAPDAAVNALSEYKGAVTALSQTIRNKSAYLMGVLRKCACMHAHAHSRTHTRTYGSTHAVHTHAACARKHGSKHACMHSRAHRRAHA